MTFHKFLWKWRKWKEESQLCVFEVFSSYRLGLPVRPFNCQKL